MVSRESNMLGELTLDPELDRKIGSVRMLTCCHKSFHPKERTEGEAPALLGPVREFLRNSFR
jgi:hypothetical protein